MLLPNPTKKLRFVIGRGLAFTMTYGKSERVDNDADVYQVEVF